MKNNILLILLLLSLNYASGQSNNQTTQDFKKLNWLMGTWNRTDTKPGRSGHERWEKINANELSGFGVNFKGADTTFMEKLHIVIKEDQIYYVGDVPENQKPVYFKLTEITDTGFICENPEHDFPKKISYQLDGKKLKAQISGNGKAIDYLFEKK
jgi:hypothetical protein